MFVTRLSLNTYKTTWTNSVINPIEDILVKTYLTGKNKKIHRKQEYISKGLAVGFIVF